jgi:hypothetical protein
MIYELSRARTRTKRKFSSLTFQRIKKCLISISYEEVVTDSIQDGLLNPNQTRSPNWWWLVTWWKVSFVPIYRGVFVTFQTEVIAAWEVIKSAVSRGITQVVLETDATFWSKLWRQRYRLSAMGGCICEIKFMVISNFTSFSVNHYFRECNRVAHAVLRLVVSASMELTGFGKLRL